jgi:hypothetical protein
VGSGPASSLLVLIIMYICLFVYIVYILICITYMCSFSPRLPQSWVASDLLSCELMSSVSS